MLTPHLAGQTLSPNQQATQIREITLNLEDKSKTETTFTHFEEIKTLNEPHTSQQTHRYDTSGPELTVGSLRRMTSFLFTDHPKGGTRAEESESSDNIRSNNKTT